MAGFMNRPQSVVIGDARRALGLSREEFGALLRFSKRTVARWETGQSSMFSGALQELAGHVYPVNVPLAEEIAAAGGARLEELGIRPLAPLPAPPPPLAGTVLVDAIVCVAANELRAVPETVRTALLAAFRRARELRMSVEDVERALSGKK